MASTSRDGDLEHEDEIRLWREGDSWVITHVETGVTTQGETREVALSNLDEALAGYRGEGESPSDDDLRALGIDPERNSSDSLEDSDVFE
jgi:predicted RNase H-like HicB family nuclease